MSSFLRLLRLVLPDITITAMVIGATVSGSGWLCAGAAIAVCVSLVGRLDNAHRTVRKDSAIQDLQCYKEALDQHAIVAITDHRGILQYVNNKFCDISQYTREELIGRSHTVINSGYHPKRFWVELWRTIGQGEVWKGEICNRARDGSLYWVDTMITPMRNSRGKITNYVAIRTDITYRKQHEEILKQNESRFQLMIDASPAKMWTTDDTGKLSYVNRHGRDITGRSLENFIEHGWEPSIHPDDRQAYSDSFREAFAQRRPFEIQCRMLDLDGNLRHFISRGAPNVDEVGSFVGFVGVVLDMGEKYRLLKELADADSRLMQISAQVPGVVYQYQLDPDGLSRFPYASQGIQDIYRVTPEDVRDDASCVFKLFHPDDRQDVIDSIQKSSETLQPWRHEYRICFGDGTTRWLYGDAIPQRESHGGTLWHGFISDITDRREAELNAEQAQSHLQAVVDAATEVSIIATDLDGTIRLFNTGAEKMLGYGADEVIGKHTPALIHLKSEVEARGRECTEHCGYLVEGFDVFVEAARHGGSDQREWTYICKNGARKTVRLVVTSVRGKDGKLEGFLGVASDITLLKQSQQALVNAASFDRLTGLPNRQMLLSTLQKRLNSNDPIDRDVIVMFLDFDRFKMVNDSLGHEVGDRLLKSISQRLQDFVGMDVDERGVVHGDLAVRLGGDEFVLVLQAKSITADIDAYTNRLWAMLAEPHKFGELQLSSTASIGVVANSGKYTDAANMVRDADVAMYRSKHSGHDRFVVFDTPMRDHVQRQQKLETDLSHAIDRSELKLAYQPIIDLQTGQFHGVELLLRWHHREEGLISPAEFVPIAEDSGLMHSIGEWVVSEGCGQICQWKEQLGPQAPKSVSLNLSPRQLTSVELTDRISNIIRDAGVDARGITFELTETALMNEPEFIAELLMRIKNIGCKISIDDFGTGHSSLASIHRFPVDTLKFDRSFIKEITNEKDLASLVHAITVLSRNLGIETVAEGIETPEQLLSVGELGCDFAQGFLIAKPMTPDEVVEFVRRGGPAMLNAVGAQMFEHRWEEKIELMT